MMNYSRSIDSMPSLRAEGEAIPSLPYNRFLDCRVGLWPPRNDDKKDKGLMYYVNLFRDDAGVMHYSTEEFAVGQQGLLNFEQAVEDAYRFSVLGDWRYICTLTPDEHITLTMRQRLKSFEQVRLVLESQGKMLRNYNIEEMMKEED